MGFALVLAAVLAGCGPGETPSYADIDAIAVHRWTIINRWPRFDATFTLRGANVEGALVAKTGLQLVGKFSESSTQSFASLERVLQAHDFYDLRLTPTQKPYLDGPTDSITVTRCGVATTIGATVSPWPDLDNSQARAFFALLDDVQRVIEQFPWKASTP